jgi:hypothetical protein
VELFDILSTRLELEFLLGGKNCGMAAAEAVSCPCEVEWERELVGGARELSS